MLDKKKRKEIIVTHTISVCSQTHPQSISATMQKNRQKKRIRLGIFIHEKKMMITKKRRIKNNSLT